MEEKERLRAMILAHREGELTKRSERNGAIAAALRELPEFRAARHVLLYISHRGEVDTEWIFGEYLGDKKLYLPKVEGEQLHIYEVADREACIPGQFGLHEPDDSCLKLEDPKVFDLVIVPGVAFDRTGHRIGYGGGFYDRFLKNISCTTIGLAYESQIIEAVPTSSYDVPVQHLITEHHHILCPT